MFVLTIDQKDSRAGADLVDALLAELADIEVAVPFERTVGDEIQGVISDPDALVSAVLIALRAGEWHIGIGIGAIDSPLPNSTREGRGPAFILAREAVDAAKSSRISVAVRAGEGNDVGGAPASTAASSSRGSADRSSHGSADENSRGSGDESLGADAAEFQALTRILGVVWEGRTSAQWEVADLLDDGLSGKEAAARLGVSAAAVSQRRRAGAYDESREASDALGIIARRIASRSPGEKP